MFDSCTCLEQRYDMSSSVCGRDLFCEVFRNVSVVLLEGMKFKNAG